MLLKNGWQVDLIGGRPRRIMQCREQHVLFQTAGVGLDPLENPRVKRMEEIAIAQEKADHFRALFKNPPGLRIGAKSKTADCVQHSCARFAADLRAGIQDARNGSDAYTRGAGHLANRHFFWNRFHCYEAPWRLRVLPEPVAKPLRTNFHRRKFSTP